MNTGSGAVSIENDKSKNDNEPSYKFGAGTKRRPYKKSFFKRAHFISIKVLGVTKIPIIICIPLCIINIAPRILKTIRRKTDDEKTKAVLGNFTGRDMLMIKDCLSGGGRYNLVSVDTNDNDKRIKIRINLF